MNGVTVSRSLLARSSVFTVIVPASLWVALLLNPVTAGISMAETFSPSGLPGLWSWAKADAGVWAEDDRVYQWDDQSGHGFHYVQSDPGRQPVYVPEARNGLPGVGEIRFRGQFMQQLGTLNAAGEFYIAVATQMVRGGTRAILGNTLDDHVSFGEDGSVGGRIGGSSRIRLTEDGAWESGQILLEVWRDTAGNLTLYINGEDKTKAPQPVNTNVFGLSGIWAKPNYMWDDTSYEFIICGELPSESERAATREYLRSRWDLYAGGPGPIFEDGLESGDTSFWSTSVP